MLEQKKAENTNSIVQKSNQTSKKAFKQKEYLPPEFIIEKIIFVLVWYVIAQNNIHVFYFLNKLAYLSL